MKAKPRIENVPNMFWGVWGLKAIGEKIKEVIEGEVAEWDTAINRSSCSAFQMCLHHHCFYARQLKGLHKVTPGYEGAVDIDNK